MKFWNPDPDRIAIAARAAAGAKLCIDVGGDNKRYRFPPAHKTVGWDGDIQCDLSSEPLPFDDNEVDFLFCRHTLEDMADPQHLLAEIKRVAKAGYLEVPSPLAETTRGVDCAGNHLGYCHHRWIGVGSGNSITLCAKYPIIEGIPLRDHWELLQRGAKHWNTHCLFGDKPLEYRVLQQSEGGFLSNVDERGVFVEYIAAVNSLMDEYLKGE